MKQHRKNFKHIVWSFFILVAVVGVYNSVTLNAESDIAQIASNKRLDEMKGIVIEGRKVATVTTWKKLENPKVQVKEEASIMSSPASEDTVIEPVLKEEISVNLVEVINSQKWQNGLSKDQFHGALSTRDGMIDSLSLSIAGENVSVSGIEMNGNVFEYEHDGELLSGLIYQADQNSYMVTLSNGPLEGTSLRFSTQSSAEPEVFPTGHFGTQTVQAPAEPELDHQEEPGLEMSAFNFENQAS